MMEKSQQHILMINKAYPPWIGGIERHVQDISEALVERGWQVTALVCNDKNFTKIEIINGVNVIRMPRLATFLSQPIATGFLRKIRDLNPNLVHVHVPFPFGWLTPSYVNSKVPVVCTWHSDIIRQRFLRVVYQPLERRFLRACHRIFPTSTPLMDHSFSLQPFRDKCRVIPLAVQPKTHNEEQVQSYLAKNKETFSGKIILYVGRLVGYKGLSYLISAMKDIDATLLIAGFGPLKSSLQAQARQIAPEKIHFLGWVSDEEKSALYQMADVFVLPSVERSEAFGYVLLEAMEHGCPLVTTDLPTGVTYVNQDQVTGLVVPPQDSAALAKAIQQILGDDELHRRFSEAARQRVAQEFSFPHTIDLLEAEYQEIVGE